MESETYKFNADIQQLMNIIINTFYSNKEIFLREFISNASDALDKLRYESIINSEKKTEELKIKISCDKKNRILVIEDTGIGMNKEDLINNIGTIASSGTKNFIEKLENSKDLSLIGQFGVGFYSGYLVSNKIIVISKKYENEQYKWESDAKGSFTIIEDKEKEYGEIKNGTKIICILQEDQLEYLEEQRIKNLIKKYSEFISYPIELSVEKIIEKEVNEEDVELEEGKVKEDGKIEEIEEDGKIEDDEEKSQEKVKKKETVKEIIYEWEQINNTEPLWLKSPEEVTKEEYISLYKLLTNDNDEYLGVKHYKIEGTIEYKSIIYIPKRPPMDMFEKKRKKNNIKLYVRRVFIMDECEEIIPEWLCFIKGIVDSDDLPLNISREMLQQNKILKAMNKNIVKKSIELFTELTEDKEKYKIFYEQYNKNIKLGIHEDKNNKIKLIELLRYKTTKNENEYISLNDYTNNMKDEQKFIYYITGESIESMKNSPFIEQLKKKDYEVIYMTDPIDEYVIQELKEYDNKQLKSCTKENLEFDCSEIEKELKLTDQKNYEELCTLIKENLNDKIEKCIISDRIVDSPVVLVTTEHSFTSNMERIMKAQALSNDKMSSYMKSKKIMEINTKHDIIKYLKAKTEQNKDDPFIKDLILLIYETSLLSSGFNLDSPANYSKMIYNIMKSSINYEDIINNNDEKIDEKIDEIIVEKTDDIIVEKTDDIIVEKTDEIIVEKSVMEEVD